MYTQRLLLVLWHCPKKIFWYLGIVGAIVELCLCLWKVLTAYQRDKRGSTYVLEWQAHTTRCWLVYWGGSRRRMDDLKYKHGYYKNYKIGTKSTLLSECVITTSATGELSIWHLFEQRNKWYSKPLLLGTLKSFGNACFSSIYFGEGYLFCGDNRGNVYITPTSYKTGKSCFSDMKDNPSDGNRKSVECSQWLSVVTGGHSRQPIRWTGFHAKSYYSAGHDGYIVEYWVTCQDKGQNKKSIAWGYRRAKPVH